MVSGKTLLDAIEEVSQQGEEALAHTIFFTERDIAIRTSYSISRGTVFYCEISGENRTLVPLCCREQGETEFSLHPVTSVPSVNPKNDSWDDWHTVTYNELIAPNVTIHKASPLTQDLSPVGINL
jgi:hypothetical protein